MRPPTKLLIAARQMLELSQAELAAEVGVGARTVYELERANGSTDNVEALTAHFESRGITFRALEGKEGWAICNTNVVGTYDDERSRTWPDKGRRGRMQSILAVEPESTESES